MSFTALYPGTCAACLDEITAGQECTYDERDEVVHVRCPDFVPDAPLPAACPRCTAIHAGEC